MEANEILTPLCYNGKDLSIGGKEKSSYKIATAFSLFCDPDWIRTNDPHLRRMTLYPAELPNHLECK